MSTTTIFHKIQAMFTGSGRTSRAGKTGQSITFVSPNEMGYCKSLRTWLKKRMKGMKPATAAEAFKRKKQVALKKIERDFEDEKIERTLRSLVRCSQIGCRIHSWRIGYVYLKRPVQDPDSLQKLKLRVKNHCHLNHPVVALVEKKGWPWKWPSWRPTPWSKSQRWPWRWTPWFQTQVQ